MAGNELDVVAVQQDAASVHALATRAFGEVDLKDPAMSLLAAWIDEIDRGIDETMPFVLPDRPTARPSEVPAPASRGRRSALIAGSTVFALVVSGGAAAAVTGDPLAVVRAPLHILGEVNPFADSEPNARERLPQQTPTSANANKLLAGAKRAMAQGDVAKAKKLLAEAEALLGGAASPGQLNRIDKLEGELAGKPDPKGKGPVDEPSKGSNDPKGKGPVDQPSKESSTSQTSGGVSDKNPKNDKSGGAESTQSGSGKPVEPAGSKTDG